MNKVILTLSLPIMLNNFIHTIYNLTDTFFVSKIPGNAVAGIQFIYKLVAVFGKFLLQSILISASQLSSLPRR